MQSFACLVAREIARRGSQAARQSLRDRLVELRGKGGMNLEELLKIFETDAHDFRMLHCRCSSHPPRDIQKRHLAKVRAGTQNGDLKIISRLGSVIDLNRAVLDEVHRVGRIVLGENLLPCFELYQL